MLCAELALRARAPDATAAVADLAEWCAEHQANCPDFAQRLPQVAALLRSAAQGPRAQADMAAGQTAVAPSDRVDVHDVPRVAAYLNATESGVRWLLGRGHLRGVKGPDGRWKIDPRSVDAYAARRAMRRHNAESRATW